MNNRVGYSFFISLALTLIFLTASLALSAGGSKPLKTDALTKDAEVIVVGKVGGLVSQWTNGHSRIETQVTLSIDQTLKGSGAENSMTVVVPGGEIDGVGEWYSHTARFERNEDVVVFAKKDVSGRYNVAGGEGGKFSIKIDKRTGAKIIPNVGTLDEFTTAIKNIAKPGDNGTVGH